MDGSAARLKSLELQGYKTFASKNLFSFAPTITAIVGPNGSGKSNIADAIRWVLGEQSFSLLRGKRTEDMIFSGSEQRPRASMAAATITFDNTDGWLPIDFSEVTIGRRAYRDGTNEYILNGQRVRLRDVNELLSQCGLSERTYTIIGQGLVDAALSLRADERRQLFEEAAGIGLYRRRREEALRRLDTTRRNMERVQDILAELRPRLRSLQRQVARSKDYEQVRSDMQALLRSWYGYHWYHLREEVEAQQALAERAHAARDALRERQGELEKRLAALRAKAEALRTQLRAWREDLSQVSAERERLGREIAVGEERVRWLGEARARLAEEIAGLEAELEGLEEELESAEAQAETERGRLRRLQDTRRRLLGAEEDGEDPREALRRQEREARQELERAIARVAEAEARREEILRRQAQRQAEAQALAGQKEARQAAMEQARASRAQAEARARRLEASLREAEETLRNSRATRQTLEAQASGLQSRLHAAKNEHAEVMAQRRALEATSGLSTKALERLQSAAQRGEVKRLLGRMPGKLRVRESAEAAVLAALGQFHVGVAFEDAESLFDALEALDGGAFTSRVAMLPVEPARRLPRLEIPAGEGVIGLAADLVEVSEPYARAFEALLGRTVVVRDRKVARRLLPSVPDDALVVTLAGDLFHPGGQVLLGLGEETRQLEAQLQGLRAQEASKAKALQRHQAEWERLQAQITAQRERMQAAEAQRERALTELTAAREALQEAGLKLSRLEQEAAQAEALDREQRQEGMVLADSLERMEATLEQARNQRASLEREHQAALQSLAALEESPELARLETQLEGAAAASERAESWLAALKARAQGIHSELEAKRARASDSAAQESQVRQTLEVARRSFAAVEARLSELKAQTEPAQQALEAIDQERSQLEAEAARLRSDLQAAEREHSQAQIMLARREEEMASLRRRIEDDFGLVSFEGDAGAPGQEPLPFEGLVEKLPRVELLPPDIEKQLQERRLQLRRMGPVNPEAQREYREVRERIEFLTSQVDDLRRAEAQIHEVIAELDVLMEREFRKTFEAVAVEFRQAFTRLFGGGSARLVLTNPEDLTHSGIDIEARLPGRRSQSLAMLSGGERSLTATALIFALLKVSPTPFCVLDEVDAMLDESNVTRFVEMLRELSRETQFILITHNRLTVQAAEVVYGVSMGADSASKVISMQLDEVEKDAVA